MPGENGVGWSQEWLCRVKMGRNGFEDEEYTRVVYLEYIEFEGTNNLLGEKSNILVVNQVLQC